MNRLPITVIVLTHNEASNLEDCLRSVYHWAQQLFVVDSGSDDGTREIAARYGMVIQHPFETHAQQWGWSLKELPISTQWVLALDADQRVMPKLEDELRRVFNRNGPPKDIDGFYIKRRQIFRGRWIRHGGYYPKYLLKLFKRDKLRIDPCDLLDHHFYIAGHLAKLRHDLMEENRKENDITFWIAKHNRYAALLAGEETLRRAQSQLYPIEPSPFGHADQRTLWLKKIWRGLPLYVRPFLYFFYRYFLRMGFLDGKEGFVFHFLHAFWFRLLVDIKIDEAKAQDCSRAEPQTAA